MQEDARGARTALGPPSLARTAVLGGWAGGALAGAGDALVVLGSTGSFWVRPLELAEPVAVHGLLGALGALLLAPLAARLRARRSRGRGSEEGAGLFRPCAVLALLVLGGAMAAIHVRDLDLIVGFGILDHLRIGALVLGGGALLWLVLGRLPLRRPGAAALGLTLLALLGPLGTRLAWARRAGEHAGAPSASAAPDLLVIVLDTTRADALSVYGNPRATSPNLDRMGREGLVYTRAYATGTWTPPSHASILTGTYPSDHRTFANRTGLGPELPTLAESLGRLGYRSFFLNSKPLLNRRDGWARGFDEVVTANVENRASFVHRRLVSKLVDLDSATPLLVRMLRRWLVEHEDDRAPLFVFLNLNDPHTRWVPREPWIGEYAAGILLDDREAARVERFSRDQQPREHPLPLTDAERGTIRARYDGEVAWMDRFLGELHAFLAAWPRERPRACLITSDHGELLGEHDLLHHRKYPWQELVHVPFLLWAEPPLGTGTRDELVSLVDVYPTLLRLAGGDPSELAGLRGRGLFEDPPPPAVFVENWLGPGQGSGGGVVARKAAITEQVKVVWESTGRTRRFDLRGGRDGEAPEELAASAEAALAELGRAFDLEASAREAAESAEEEGDRLEQLRKLGYASDEP